MAEHRHDDRQTEKEWQRADHQQDGDNETPQTPSVSGLATTTRIDVNSATAAPTSRSSNNGKEMAPIVSTNTANRKPTPVPTTIRGHPAEVVNTSSTN